MDWNRIKWNCWAWPKVKLLIVFFFFFKNYAASENWTTYHSPLGNGGGMYLNLTNLLIPQVLGIQTSPTSSYFYVGTNSKTNGGTMIAYCFAIQGYSKFGSYTGNGNADGTFVYTGFKPAWVMIKRTDAVENWIMLDNKREPFNVVTKRLYADTNGAESTSRYSNGLCI